MVESRRQPTVAPSPSPSIAASQSPSAQAAPQRTGNAAAQERLGLGAAAPSPADSLAGALDTLGDMGAVVLDALPLDQALRLAVQAQRQTWAQAWVRAQPARDLLAHADDLLRAGFDQVWPVGFEATIDGGANVAMLAKVVGEASLGLARTATGMAVTFSGAVDLGATVGLGAKLNGANDANALGAGLEANLLYGRHLDATWDFATADVLRAFAEHEPAGLNELLLGGVALRGSAGAVLVRLALATPPTRWSLGDRLRGDATASVADGGASSAELGLEAQGSLTIGQEGGESYVEASRAGSASAGQDHKLFELLRTVGFPDWDLRVGERLRVRLFGPTEALSALDFSELGAEIGLTLQDGDRAMEDTFRAARLGDAARWLAGRLNPLDTLFGAEGPAVPAADLPDVSLRRSLTRSVDDVSEIQDPGVVGALVELATPDDHAFTTLSHHAELSAEVVVPVAAVRAALDGAALPPGPEGIEVRVLEVARVLAAAANGTRYVPPAGIPALDLDAGLAATDVSEVEAAVSWEARAGLGGEVDAVAGVEAGAHAGLTFTQRGTLPLDEAQRRELFAS